MLGQRLLVSMDMAPHEMPQATWTLAGARARVVARGARDAEASFVSVRTTRLVPTDYISSI